MSVPPILIAEKGPTASPASYTVPGSQEMRLSSVTATFNGAAAGGNYLPCLSIYAQSGELLSRTFPGTGAVTAGSDAEVTYIPFTPLATATPSSGSTLPIAHFSGGTLATAPGNPFNRVVYSWTAVSTSDASVFAISGADATRAQVLKAGVYQLEAVVSPVSSPQAITGAVTVNPSQGNTGGTGLGLWNYGSNYFAKPTGATSLNVEFMPAIGYVNQPAGSLPGFIQLRVQSTLDTFNFTADLVMTRINDYVA